MRYVFLLLALLVTWGLTDHHLRADTQPTLRIYHAAWCAPCQKMKNEVLDAVIADGFYNVELVDITNDWNAGVYPPHFDIVVDGEVQFGWSGYTSEYGFWIEYKRSKGAYEVYLALKAINDF